MFIIDRMSSTSELFLTFCTVILMLFLSGLPTITQGIIIKQRFVIILRRLVGLAVAVNARTGVAGYKECSSPTLEKHSP